MQSKIPPPPVVKSSRIPLEREVEKRFISKWQRAGGVSWKFTSPARRSVSDRVCLYFGRVIFVEFKREGKDLTPKQLKFANLVVEQGGEAVCVIGDAGVAKFLKAIVDDERKTVGVERFQ